MKSKCIEYFPPNEIWDKCIFVLDANVLVKIHEDGEKTRKKWLSVLAKVKDRVWVPHQFATEYLDHQLSRTRKRITVAKTTIKTQLESIEKKVGDIGHDEKKIKGMLVKLAEISKSLNEDLEGIAQETPLSAAKDPVRQEIVEFFEGRVGDPLSPERYLNVLEQGEIRFRNGVPPGFGDADKPANRFGDLIGWVQILDEAKTRQAPVMFLTFERKPDWWKHVDGEPVMPRPELSREMMAIAGQAFGIMPFQDFAKKVAEEFEIMSKTLNEAISAAQKQSEEVTKSYKSFFDAYSTMPPLFSTPVSLPTGLSLSSMPSFQLQSMPSLQLSAVPATAFATPRLGADFIFPSHEAYRGYIDRVFKMETPQAVTVVEPQHKDSDRKEK